MCRFALTLCLLLCVSLTAGNAGELSDDEIRQMLIDASIAAYPGNCPCPYNTDRSGRRCGARSAYSRPGGYGPLCFTHDVTEDMVQKYRRRIGASRT